MEPRLTHFITELKSAPEYFPLYPGCTAQEITGGDVQFFPCQLYSEWAQWSTALTLRQWENWEKRRLGGCFIAGVGPNNYNKKSLHFQIEEKLLLSCGEVFDEHGWFSLLLVWFTLLSFTADAITQKSNTDIICNKLTCFCSDFSGGLAGFQLNIVFFVHDYLCFLCFPLTLNENIIAQAVNFYTLTIFTKNTNIFTDHCQFSWIKRCTAIQLFIYF